VANSRSTAAEWGETLSRKCAQQTTSWVGHGSEQATALEQIEEPRFGNSLRAGLLEAEFVGPGNQGRNISWS
jgi:hypothetical protein